MINCVRRAAIVDPEIQSSLKYFIPSIWSLNCVHTLERRLVAHSPSLSYYSQILSLKAAKNSFIQFSSTVLYFNDDGTEENVFFLMSFFTLLRKNNRNKNYAKFASFSLAFPMFRTHHHVHASIFLYFFSVWLFYTKLTQKNKITNTQVFYLHVVYLKCTHKHWNRFFESRYSFETFTGVSFPEFLTIYFYFRT